MKKLITISLTLMLAFGTTSQATTAPVTDTTAESAPETAVANADVATADATSASTEAVADSTAPATETETVATVSPQVAKLIAMYPRLVARIEPHGKVCFEGEECDITISVLSASADGSPRDGATIYKAVCHTCHEAGLVGAPKYGNAGDWASRITKGKETLYHNAINGINAMPAKGGADIPDEEVKNAVDYMVQAAS